MSTIDDVDSNQPITELLKKIAELKNTVQIRKNEHLVQLKDEATVLQTQIAEAMAKQNEIIQTLKGLEVTPEELAGFPPEIVSVFTKRGRKGRASVIYNGQPMSASAVCEQLGLEIGGDSAVRVLQRYLKAHPSENIQIL